MLHFETVEPGTFSILEKMMVLQEFKDFALEGDTALSLLYGHRISEDLDLFSNIGFESEQILKALQKSFWTCL